MERILGILAGIGVSRDIGVNLVTDFLFTVVLSAFVALVTNWLRDCSEAKNAKQLLQGVYRSADQCIVNYLCAGRVLSHLTTTDSPAVIDEKLNSLSLRFQEVVFDASRFEQHLGMVGAALSRSAFGRANSVSNGLAYLREHSAQMDRNLSGWRKDISTGRSSSEIAAGRLAFWLDILELAAEDLDGRKGPLATRRVPPVRQRPLRLEKMTKPTGGLMLKSLRPGEIKALSAAIWRSAGVDRETVQAILGGNGHSPSRGT